MNILNGPYQGALKPYRLCELLNVLWPSILLVQISLHHQTVGVLALFSEDDQSEPYKFPQVCACCSPSPPERATISQLPFQVMPLA